jgi:hypothetical protein
MKERLYEMERRRQIKKQAREQMELLGEYRAERERLRRSGCYIYNMHAEDSIEIRELDIKSVIDAHDTLWKAFEMLCGTLESASLGYEDVPWLPDEVSPAKYLTHTAQNVSGVDPVKKAYARACLRWHPDKFQHKYGKWFSGGEWNRVLEKVQRVSQDFNNAWEEYKIESK